MAKKKVECELADWKDVDAALERIAQIDRETARQEVMLNRKVDELKAECSAKVEPIQAEKKRLEKELETFCELRKGEFEKTRNKALVFGRVGFRTVAKIVVHNSGNTVEAIRRFFGQAKAETFLNVKVTVNKEALEQLADEDLRVVGCSRKVADSFSYEVNALSLEG